MTSNPSDAPSNWPAIAERLAVLVQSVGDIAPDLHGRVPSDDLWQFKALVDTGDDIYATTIVALRAIDELGKEAHKISNLGPDGGYDTDDRLRSWAADPAGHGRPQWTVVAMAATAWCNVLEGFLNGISATAINVHAVARVRKAFPDVEIDWASVESARPLIASRVRPSTKKKAQWFRYIEAVFGCNVDANVAIALRSLVSFRNAVIHPERGRSHDEHRRHALSDEWVAWSLAVRALAGTVMRALADRLDERRAAGEVIPLFPDGRGNPPLARRTT
jgi:hypothetical protein